jgi:hypothetical protein
MFSLFPKMAPARRIYQLWYLPKQGLFDDFYMYQVMLELFLYLIALAQKSFYLNPKP